ncbi:hypothetical protein [Afipia broomeae]|uniref:Uncharacterized protein n=1 Tax=Afipia broomeae ATCC 49717 TaxID=883078 RepID=K8P007_9BRAD|nr:hypothetical protein [Afipia broomeae]EKS34741.1 hypothetical protein HMPREF9695_04651 [Afipia broomeae ATCC 49717]
MIAFAEKVWLTLSPFQPQILAFAFTLAGTLIAYLLRARVKLIYGFANNSFHQLKADQGPVVVFCEKHYVQNAGKKPAEKVEIVFSCKPSEITVYPPRSFEQTDGPDGQMMLAIPYLSPGELVIIDTIHVNSRTAELRAVHCPENVGKRVEFWVQRKFGRLFNLFWIAMAFLGLFYAIQLLIALIATFAKAAS